MQDLHVPDRAYQPRMKMSVYTDLCTVYITCVCLRTNTGCNSIFVQSWAGRTRTVNKRIIVILCPVYSFKQFYVAFYNVVCSSFL